MGRSLNSPLVSTPGIHNGYVRDSSFTFSRTMIVRGVNVEGEGRIGSRKLWLRVADKLSTEAFPSLHNSGDNSFRGVV